jgi:hypothetical protein
MSGHVNYPSSPPCILPLASSCAEHLKEVKSVNPRLRQVIEAYQYAFHQEAEAAHDDPSVPIHRWLFRGPNTYPDPAALPGFLPTVDELTGVYHRLTHKLGHLICESLGEDRARPHFHFIPKLLTYSAPLFLKRQCDRTPGEDPAHFDAIFDFDKPDLAASLSHNWSMARIGLGRIVALYNRAST